MTAKNSNQDRQNSIPGKVTFLEGHGDLPMIEISTAWSTAEIYLHGAHVTHFKKKNEAPLLFLSQCSRFEKGKPIRGGVPIIFPWFGMREGLGQHGFARHNPWQIKEVLPASDGSVSVRFRFLDCPESAMCAPFLAEYVVTVNAHLTLELSVTNKSETDEFEFENCLHTYFFVEDISAVSVHGLKGATYLDRLANGERKTESAEAIRISSEVDRTYFDTTGAVEIRDARLGRAIKIAKENSTSTVLWNPWITKSQQMADFGNEEFRNMLCVESGNVMTNKIILPPGKSSVMKVTLSSAPLK